MISFLFAALLLSDTPAPSAQQTPPAPAVAASDSKKAEKKICQVDPNYTGTRMRKKLCLTQAEWNLKAQGKNAGDLKTMGAR